MLPVEVSAEYFMGIVPFLMDWYSQEAINNSNAVEIADNPAHLIKNQAKIRSPLTLYKSKCRFYLIFKLFEVLIF